MGLNLLKRKAGLGSVLMPLKHIPCPPALIQGKGKGTARTTMIKIMWAKCGVFGNFVNLAQK